MRRALFLFVVFICYVHSISAQVVSMESYAKRVYKDNKTLIDYKDFQTTSILNYSKTQRKWEIYTDGKKYTYTIKSTQKGEKGVGGKSKTFVCTGENGAKYTIDFVYMSDITGDELFLLEIKSPWKKVIYYIDGNEYWKNYK